MASSEVKITFDMESVARWTDDIVPDDWRKLYVEKRA